jgi:pilus assembly protein CpaE
MTILCEVDDMTRGSLGASLGDRAHVVTSLTAATVALAADPHEHVVVIGARIDLDEALDFTQHVQAEYDYIAVVLLRFSLEPDVLESARLAGIHEVAVVGDLAGVTAAIARAEGGAAMTETVAPEAPVKPQPRGGLVVVFAAKGGCGKTTVATNLATVLNDDGAHSVALVDLDLEFGDVAVALRLTPARTLVDAVDLKRLDPLNVGGLLTPYRPQLDCVLAPVEPGDAERIPVERISQLLDALLATHEYVVVDTPSQLSEPVLAAMDMAHHFILLTTPEITALKNLRLTLDMLDLLGYDPNARAIVFNRSDARAGLSAADVESAIKTPISVRIPSSYDVPASINKGVPLAQSNPKHPVSIAIREIADTQITGSAGDTHSSHRQSGRRGRKLRMRSS